MCRRCKHWWQALKQKEALLAFFAREGLWVLAGVYLTVVTLSALYDSIYLTPSGAVVSVVHFAITFIAFLFIPLWVWITALGLKYLFRRKRPFEEKRAKPAVALWKTPSFPSGHATLAWAMGLVLVEYFGMLAWQGAGLAVRLISGLLLVSTVVLVLGVSISRVLLDLHRWRDVIFAVLWVFVWYGILWWLVVISVG